MASWNQIVASVNKLERDTERKHRKAMLEACIKGDKSESEARAFKIEQMHKAQWKCDRGLRNA